MEISAVVLTKNSEEKLAECLKSLRFAAEILVIDDGSVDWTTKIAEKHGAKVIERKLNGDFVAQRNFGLKKAKHDWVLFVDSDEVVSKHLQYEILKMTQSDRFSGYKVRRENHVLGSLVNFGEYKEDWVLRLARKGTGRWRRKVHETWDIGGEVGKLTITLTHYPHKNIEQFIDKILLYFPIHARENKNENKRVNIFIILIYPAVKFIHNYIVRQGFRDETRGFILAVLSSFHSFLAWSDYYQKENY